MNFDPKPMFGEPITDWERRFAVWPVRTWNGLWRWLCFVECRLIQVHGWLVPGGGEVWWQYRRAQKA